MIVVPAEGQAWIGQLVANQPITVRLFINDVRPGPWDTGTTFVEPDGYTPIVLGPGDWTVKKGTLAPATVLQGRRHTFDVRGPVTVFGYFLTPADARIIVGAERFGEPFAAGQAGGTVAVTPRVDITATK